MCAEIKINQKGIALRFFGAELTPLTFTKFTRAAFFSVVMWAMLIFLHIQTHSLPPLRQAVLDLASFLLIAIAAECGINMKAGLRPLLFLVAGVFLLRSLMGFVLS